MMLKFIEKDDGVINILDELGDPVGDIIIEKGFYRVSLLFAYGSGKGLHQIADKLDELNNDKK